MRLAALIRVSTDGQALRGGSLDDQRSRLQQWAVAHQHEVVREYGEGDRSGGSLKSSPSFAQMLADAGGDQWDGVAVESADRFRRNNDDAFAARKILRERGKALYFLDIGDVDLTGTDAAAEMAFAMLSTFSSQERLRFVARGQKAHRTRIARGAWSGGPAPLGYTWEKVDGRLVLAKLDDEREVTGVIWRYLIDGRTPHQIARTLNDAGLRTRAGNRFSQPSVHTIARNPIYAGYTYSYAEEPEASSRRRRIHGKLGERGQWEPYVDTREWEEVQARMAHRRKSTGSRGGRPSARFLLSGGLGKCGTCGASLYTKFDAYREHYWCSSAKTERPCGTRPIPREPVDFAVRQQVLSLDLIDLQSAVSGFTDAVERERKHLRQRIRRTNTLCAQLSRDLDQLAEEPTSPTMTDLYERKRRVLSEREGQLSDLEHDLSNLENANSEVEFEPLEELVEELRRRFVINVDDTALLRTQLADAFTHITVTPESSKPTVTLAPREDFIEVLLGAHTRPFSVHESTRTADANPQPWVFAPAPSRDAVLKARRRLAEAIEQVAATPGPLARVVVGSRPPTREGTI